MYKNYDEMIDLQVRMIASNWEWKFANLDMSKEDLAEFNKQCKDAGISPLDVYPYMNE